MRLLILLLSLVLAAVALAAGPSSQPTVAWWVPLLAWLKLNWVKIVLGLLIPSLITALTPYPKAKGLVAFLQALLDRLSIFTHYDSPGTLNWPGVRSKPPKNHTPSSPPPVVTMLLIGALALSSTGCCVFKGNCKEDDHVGQIATVVVDCASEAIKTRVAEILPAVIAIVTGNAGNWSEQLAALTELGLDIVACALQQSGQEVQNLISSGRLPHLKAAAASQPSVAQQRIEKFLSAVKTKDGKVVRVVFKR